MANFYPRREYSEFSTLTRSRRYESTTAKWENFMLRGMFSRYKIQWLSMRISMNLPPRTKEWCVSTFSNSWSFLVKNSTHKHYKVIFVVLKIENFQTRTVLAFYFYTQFEPMRVILVRKIYVGLSLKLVCKQVFSREFLRRYFIKEKKKIMKKLVPGTLLIYRNTSEFLRTLQKCEKHSCLVFFKIPACLYNSLVVSTRFLFLC